MDINKRLEALKLSSSDTENSTDDTINERFCVVDFFKKGSAGQDVFATAIVPFLSLDDLVNGSACCRAMNSFCHTYTVGEIVSLHSMDHISGRHKTELGKFIFGFVSPSFSSHRSHHRRIHQEIDSFWDRLYHPVLVPEIELGMAAYFNQHGIEFDTALMNDYDWDLNTDANKPTIKSYIDSKFERECERGFWISPLLHRRILNNQSWLILFHSLQSRSTVQCKTITVIQLLFVCVSLRMPVLVACSASKFWSVEKTLLLLPPPMVHPPLHDTGGYTFETSRESRSILSQVQLALPPDTVMFFSERPTRQSSGKPWIDPATPADATEISSKVTFRKSGFPDWWGARFSP